MQYCEACRAACFPWVPRSSFPNRTAECEVCRRRRAVFGVPSSDTQRFQFRMAGCGRRSKLRDFWKGLTDDKDTQA